MSMSPEDVLRIQRSSGINQIEQDKAVLSAIKKLGAERRLKAKQNHKLVAAINYGIHQPIEEKIGYKKNNRLLPAFMFAVAGIGLSLLSNFFNR
jgi:hypothetical protein